MEGNSRIALFVVTLAIFTDMLIYSMVVPVLPKYALELGTSPQLIGIMFASYAIAFLISTPAAGWISDRTGRRTTMIVGLAGLLISTMIFAGADNIVMLTIARALQGVSAAATWTAGLALLSDLFPPQARQQATGTALAGSFAGILIGPTLGGFLLEFGGYRLPFIVAAGLILIDGIARVFLLKDPAAKNHGDLVSVMALAKTPSVAITAGVITLMAALSGMLEPILPLHLQAQLHASPGSIGALFSMIAITGIVCSPLSYMIADKCGRKRVIISGLIVSAILLPFLVIQSSLIPELIIAIMIGASLSVVQASIPQELTDAIDRKGKDGYGAAYALYNIALSLGMMIGPITGGLLTGSFGIFTAMSIAGAGIIVYTVILAASTRPTIPTISGQAP